MMQYRYRAEKPAQTLPINRITRLAG